jgi:1,4-dihydroxy-2-naphthoate octaprenyltransferase
MNDFFFGPGIVLITLFVSTGYTIYTFIKASHLERMAKIEKGIDTNSPSNNSRYLELKLGMLMVGIAFGLLLAYLLEKTLKLDEVVFYPSFMLLFGGVSLIASFFWAKKLQKNK